MRKLVRVTVAAMLAGALLFTAACSEVAAPDQVGLFYAKGQVDGFKFDHCVAPGSVDDWAANNEVIWLEDNLRTWNIAKEGGDTSIPITVASKPEPNQPSGVQVNVWSLTNLRLNTTCRDANSPIVKWWETIGRRYQANTIEGWKMMLLNTVVPALEKSKRTVVRNYSADGLVAGLDLPKLQAEISAEFGRELERVVGGKFFCGPAFVRGSDECPDVEVQIKDVDYTDSGIQDARNQKVKALEMAAANVAEAEGKVRAAAAQEQLYQNAAWVELEKARLQLEQVKACGGECTVIIGGNGGTIVTR